MSAGMHVAQKYFQPLGWYTCSGRSYMSAGMHVSSIYIPPVMSECTALLSQKLGFGGVSNSGFISCAAPTYYCGSEYFYIQCPQVWKLIRTEHSLNIGEHRVKNKAKLRVFPINQKSEIQSYFQYMEIGLWKSE